MLILRIVFLSVDDEFAGAMQRFVYERHPDWVVGSVISAREVPQKTVAHAFVFLLKQSGFYYIAQMAHMKLLKKLLGTDNMRLPSRLAERDNVPIYRCSDINSEESIAVLESWKPDLVISTNFNHYIRRKARQVAKLGTWNLHKSYLPDGRGIAPSFFVLLAGARFTGSTLHVVDVGFDTGDILTQEKVPIEPCDTVYSLNVKTSEVGGRMLLNYLEARPDGPYPATPQPRGDWKNNTYPSKTDVKRFRRQRLKFV